MRNLILADTLMRADQLSKFLVTPSEVHIDVRMGHSTRYTTVTSLK